MSLLHHLRELIRAKHFAIGFGLFLLVLFGSLAWVAFDVRPNPIPKKLAREEANTQKNIVNDVTELNPIQTQGIIVPHTIEEIAEAVKTHERVSIGGGRNSMGGQTASERAVQIDMREYNKILDFSKERKEITVQAGTRWRDIQDYIDPHQLSVKIMQTYANFTVGGSLSVNVHGRYIGLGPVILSVKQFRIVLADGSIITASPTENADIFYSAIGGMGGIGVISDVTLALDDNVNVERSRVKLKTGEYAQFFKEQVRSNPDVIFHNGDMYPLDFEQISAVSWTKTDREPTTIERLIPRFQDYWKERIAWVVMSEWPAGRFIREHFIDPLLYAGEQPVHTRNYEASYDVAELEPKDRDQSTYVLQEYFVPVERFDEWVPKMKKVFNDFDVNVINVSIRHALPDSGAKLAWAPKESFAFVVYYKQSTDEASKQIVRQWTQAMIDAVLTVDGRYYLPYQIWASDDQFHRAYPGALDYFAIKKQYDPTNKFTNKLWDAYYSDEKVARYQERKRVLERVKEIPDYFRPFDNTYLSLPEWYIVYAAEEYAEILKGSQPSEFDYFGTNREYWKQHAIVQSLTASNHESNAAYNMVLQVIGWSFSTENFIKGIYENTIGYLFERLARGEPTPEDRYAAQVASDYAKLLYDYPWYDFSYWNVLKGLWQLPDSEGLTFGQDLRRMERKLILSGEYAVKALYASVIAYATHQEFGVQDDQVTAVFSRNGGETLDVVQAAHYQPFTRALLGVLEREAGNPGFQLFDIAGNERIALVYTDIIGAPVPTQTKEVVRDTRVMAVEEGDKKWRDQITVEVAVRDLPAAYRFLKERGIEIHHFYDY